MKSSLAGPEPRILARKPRKACDHTQRRGFGSDEAVLLESAPLVGTTGEPSLTPASRPSLSVDLVPERFTGIHLHQGSASVFAEPNGARFQLRRAQLSVTRLNPAAWPEASESTGTGQAPVTPAEGH